jgi:hypothetical protein
MQGPFRTSWTRQCKSTRPLLESGRESGGSQPGVASRGLPADVEQLPPAERKQLKYPIGRVPQDELETLEKAVKEGLR